MNINLDSVLETFLDFNYFVIFSIISLFISMLLLFISYIVANNIPKDENPEKSTPYECGFEPFNDARNFFNIQFYTLGILFILFDLEIAFLYPWAICLSFNGLVSFWVMFFFLGILTIGFFYEWNKGALDWKTL